MASNEGEQKGQYLGTSSRKMSVIVLRTIIFGSYSL